MTEHLSVGVTRWAMFGNSGAQRGPGGFRKWKSRATSSLIPKVPAEQTMPKGRRPRLGTASHRDDKVPWLPAPGREGTSTQSYGSTHPIGIRQSLAFSFSIKREVIFPGFPLSARDMDSTLGRRKRRRR